MRQRRRVERGRFAATRDRSQPVVSRRDVENRQRQFLLIGAGIALTIVVVLVGAALFVGLFQPPRKVVATVAGDHIRLSELVTYTSLAALESGGALRPDLALNDLVRDRVISARSGDLGVNVTEAAIESGIARRFEPFVAGATEPADALTEAGRSSLNLVLDTFDVSEARYREWLVGQLLVVELQDYFHDQQPDALEQVFVEWIVTASSLTAQTAMDRIAAGEEFATVAGELSTDFLLANAEGEVGWVPRGAMKELDSVLFAPDLELNTLIGPLTTSLGSVVLQVTDGPSEKMLSDIMREFVAADELQQWLDGIVSETLEDRMTLSADDFEWVIDQIA
jgi:hypothetical protein